MKAGQEELTPYVGPRPFERIAQDQARFFGRDQETEEIVSLIFGHPLVLVYAQSGAGKTSLFNARIAPAFEENGFEVLPLSRVRGAIPEGIEPQDITNLYVFNALLDLEPEADSQALVDKSLAAFLEEHPRPTSAKGKPFPRVIIFDQFEELFTLYPEQWHEQREAFFRQVAEALDADPLLRFVLVLREDYLAQLDPFARLLPEELRTRFRMERLGKEAALAAVKGPLRDTRRSFAEGAAEQLVEELLKIRVEAAAGETVEVTGEFIEPVQLQVVCQSLWQDLPPDVTVITQDHLQAFGDVDQALSGFYERSIKRAAEKTSARERGLRAWFERNLITPAGTRGTVYQGREETGGIPNATVDMLENLHLIRGERRAGARWYELTHDRFIDPIQRSNEAWRAMRRGRWLRIGVTIAAFLILLSVGIAAVLTTELLAAEVTAVLAVNEATKTARQSQATATAVAAELSKADYVRQGLVYAEQGDYGQAITYYDQAIELDPDYADAYFYQGLAYSNLGDHKQAIADYTKAIELDPNYAKAYNNRGVAYYYQGDYEQAIADYSKAIELDPDYAEAYNNRGVAHRKLGNYEQGIADYNKAIELDPNYVEAYASRGYAYYGLSDYEQAIADYTNAIELDPHYVEAYTSRGYAYYGLSDYEQAIADYTNAIELDPHYVEAYTSRGYAYYGLSDYEQAIADYTNAIELDPSYAKAYNNRGFAYYYQGDYEQAIADYSKAIELDPDYAEAYNNRGFAYYDLGDYEQAIADYNKAIEFDPSYAKAYNNRGLAYYYQGDYEQAIADYNKAIELDPNYAKAYNNRGVAYRKLGNYEQGIADYNKAIELDPNYVEAYASRGYAYYGLSDYEQAIADYTKAIELDPDYVLAYQNRGLAYADQGKYDLAISDYTRAGNVYHELGDYGQAIANYTKAIELDPNYAPAYDNRGLVYADQGKYDLAISDFTKAIELDPDYAEAYNNRGLAYYDLGDYEQAIADYDKAIELDPNYANADEYEIDDFQAKDIILGQPQLHNFHPVYDVDKVKFLAKGERTYRVFTTILDTTKGVDTYLEVNVGGVSYANDDCDPECNPVQCLPPNDLSSCVQFQVQTGYDVEAIVVMSNRGQYGPEMLYQITIEEFVSTPTPMPPTPTPRLPTPTAMPRPPTPTATPSTLLPAPILITPSEKCLDSSSITLRWEWALALRNNQWFDVYTHALDCPGRPRSEWPPEKAARVRDTRYTLTIPLTDRGCNYQWQVVVIQEKEDGTSIEISGPSEEWSFWWVISCGPTPTEVPPTPEPTRTPSP